MTDARHEELLGRLLDDELSEAEADEFAAALRASPERARDARQHLALWELFAQRRAPERSARAFELAWRTRLAAEADATRFVARTVGHICTDSEKNAAEATKTAEDDAVEPVDLRRGVRSPLLSFPSVRWFALAASVALLLGVSMWFFGPTMGEPELAEVTGGVRLERMGQPSAIASTGMRLQSGDVLVTETNGTAALGFGEERTRLEVGAGTELRLASLRSGKRFDLRAGRLVADVARQRPFGPLVVTTPNAEAVVVGTKFSLTATTNRTRLDVAEGKVWLVDTTGTNAGAAVKVGTGHYAVVAAATELAVLPKTGGITREWWNGVSGGAVHDLLGHARFPNQPDGREVVTTLETNSVTTNDFGCRFRGHLHPGVTGDHVFWLASGGEATLYLSPDERTEERFPIANSGGAQPRQWDRGRFRGASQFSTPIRLVAGRHYYLEVVLKVKQGPAHVAVAWQQPGQERELISGEFLSPVEPTK